MKSKRLKNLDKNVSYAFIGRWSDGKIGWCVPVYLDGYGDTKHGRRSPARPTARDMSHFKDVTVTLCKVTVEVVKDKLGREIRRTVKES